MKKLIASVLLIGMMLSQSAFAAESSHFSDVPSNASYAEAVNTLADMGILNGDKEGRFNPDKTITRAEAATVICNLMGVSEDAKKIKQSAFTDVSSNYWAAGYIAKANELGIISGYSKTKFGPNDPVTYEQFIKMLICAWEYDEDAIKEGGYPNGYIKTAETLGIVNGVSFKQTSPCLRKDVASFTYNIWNIAPGNFNLEG